MFGPEYFTVGGYKIKSEEGEWVGDVLCRACGEKAELLISDSVSVAELEEAFGEDGLWCDECGDEIVEAFYRECGKCSKRTEVDDLNGHGDCPTCQREYPNS